MVIAQTPTITENYVKTKNYKTPTTVSVLTPSPTQALQNVTYFDGLGRPIQQVANAQTISNKDLITHIEYDMFGRQMKEYLPYASSQNNMSFVNSNTLKANTIQQYQSMYGDSIAFSEKVLENSPLNRVLKQGAPGNDWSVNGNHSIRFDYQTNAVLDSVKYFTVSVDWISNIGLYDIPTSLTVNDYPNFQLYKTITKDENWVAGLDNTTEEFKDKEGKVILKRTYNNSEKHDTYYVYDQYGNLTFVLPPEVDTNQTITSTVLDNLCYQYKYDSRNRLVEKKLPGKQWEFIVYDKLDRVVATGPSYSPFTNFTAPNNVGWMITKYDVFNRPILSAWMPSASVTATGRKTLQDSYNVASIFNETKTTTNITVNGVAFRYTNTALPTTGYHLLTINYYDDYSSNLTFSPAIAYTAIFGQTLFNNTTIKPKGLLTMTWVRVPETSTLYKSERSYSLFDLKGRVVRSVTTNYLGGYTRVDNQMEFITGRINYSETRSKRLAADTELYVKDTYTYTNQDKLLSHIHKIGTAGIPQLLYKNSYDELGQLTSKQVGGTDVTTYVGLQNIDYNYNIRGWLTNINEVDALQKPGVPKDLFAFKLNYNEVENETNYVGKPLFNGNIAETYWITTTDDIKRKYGYNYDALNRLTSAVYQKPNSTVPVTNSYNEILSYDKNGNIQTLLRTGEYDDAIFNLTIDNLTYNYDVNNRNLLKSVDDSSGIQAGFFDVSGGTDYNYDANGNLKTDTNKGITDIVYNHLNQPTKITFGTNGTIDYLYDATGRKLRKKVTEVTIVNTTDYLNGYQYTQIGTTGAIVLDFFAHAEGYVKNTIVNSANVYSYVYNYTDHLGNIRLSYGLHNNVLTILEENNYYPYGMKHSNYNVSRKQYNDAGGVLEIETCTDCSYKYKYNGKEYQDELGLNMYDYGARNYDPAIARWVNKDPLAEIYHTDSPYSYVMDNPLSYIDPDGRRLVGVTKDNAKNVHDDINTVFADSKFDKVRGLFTRGEKNNKKAFDKIDGDALKDALSGLTGDDLALAELVTGAVNSSVEYKVEYVEEGKELSTEGQAAINDYWTNLYTKLGHRAPDATIRTGTDISSSGGEGFTVPTTNGSHAFIVNGKNTQHGEGKRALTTFHEIFGHGVAIGKKVSDYENATNSIRAENLVRRVLQIQNQRDGSDHAGGRVYNAQALPIIKN